MEFRDYLTRALTKTYIAMDHALRNAFPSYASARQHAREAKRELYLTRQALEHEHQAHATDLTKLSTTLSHARVELDMAQRNSRRLENKLEALKAAQKFKAPYIAEGVARRIERAWSGPFLIVYDGKIAAGQRELLERQRDWTWNDALVTDPRVLGNAALARENHTGLTGLPAVYLDQLGTHLSQNQQTPQVQFGKDVYAIIQTRRYSNTGCSVYLLEHVGTFGDWVRGIRTIFAGKHTRARTKRRNNSQPNQGDLPETA